MMEPSASTPLALARWALLAAVICLTLAGCEPERPAVTSGASQLPPYTAAESALFDDTFSPDFFGLERPTPIGEDSRLAARARAADTVLAGQVSTVTRDSRGQSASYVLVVIPTGVVRGSAAEGPVTLNVDAASPSFPWVRSADTDLVGKAVILFAKRYNDGGSAVLHFHAEPDSPEMRRAVERAMLLSEVGS